MLLIFCSLSLDSQTMRMNGDEGDDGGEDPFTSKLMSFEQGGGDYQPVVIGRNTLKKLSRTTVFVKQFSPPLRFKYFRNLIPEISITMCKSCQRVREKDFFLYTSKTIKFSRK